MRIALFSDVHGDFVPGNRRNIVLSAIADALVAAGTDVVIIAGDLANDVDHLRKILPPLAVGRWLNAIVPGNHDVWRTETAFRSGHTSFGALSLFRARAEAAGFRYLPEQPVVVTKGNEKWGFVGSLGWYDYTFADPNLVVPPGAYERKTWGHLVHNDSAGVLWMDGGRKLVSDPQMTSQCLRQIERDLRTIGLDESGAGVPTVAVTHTLPYRELVEVRGVPDWDFFNAFMGSARLGDLYDKFPKVRAAFAGHVHRPKGFVRPDGFVAACAPLGYYGTEEFPVWDMGARIAFFDTIKGSLIRVKP
jgi:Icc-related predicted phosphoesterase